jgi:hypothetical protein
MAESGEANGGFFWIGFEQWSGAFISWASWLVKGL